MVERVKTAICHGLCAPFVSSQFLRSWFSSRITRVCRDTRSSSAVSACALKHALHVGCMVTSSCHSISQVMSCFFVPLKSSSHTQSSHSIHMLCMFACVRFRCQPDMSRLVKQLNLSRLLAGCEPNATPFSASPGDMDEPKKMWKRQSCLDRALSHLALTTM